MFPDFNFVDCLVMLLGTLLCFKRVAEMERYHGLRVIVLTSILGVVVLLLFLAFGSSLFEPQYDCYPAHFCQTEM